MELNTGDKGMPPPPTIQALVAKAVRGVMKESKNPLRISSSKKGSELGRKRMHNPKVTWGPTTGALPKKSSGPTPKQSPQASVLENEEEIPVWR